eukprot:842458-Pelagomonas_calceolata.AAC.1
MGATLAAAAPAAGGTSRERQHSHSAASCWHGANASEARAICHGPAPPMTFILSKENSWFFWCRHHVMRNEVLVQPSRRASASECQQHQQQRNEQQRQRQQHKEHFLSSAYSLAERFGHT